MTSHNSAQLSLFESSEDAMMNNVFQELADQMSLFPQGGVIKHPKNSAKKLPLAGAKVWHFFKCGQIVYKLDFSTSFVRFEDGTELVIEDSELTVL